MLSLMRLDRWLLSSLSVVTRPTAMDAVAEGKLPAGESDEVIFSFTPDIRRHMKEPAFWITLEMTAKWPKKKPSRFDNISVCVQGFFSFPPDTSEATIRQYVPILCLTNLIGIARGLVAQATAFCPGGAFIIPLIDANVVVRGFAAGNQALSPGRLKNTPKKNE